MSTSGTSSFTANLDQIIQRAARKVNAIGTGVTMSYEMKRDFKFELNAMVKSWNAMGIHVWTNAEATLFPQAGQVKYAAGSGASDHITETYHETETTSDSVLNQTTINLDDTSNITIADFLGVVLDDGTIHWASVTGKTSTSATIDGTGLADTAATGNAVFNYTSKIVKPLAVVDYRRYDIDGQTDTPIDPTSRKEYNALPTKNEAGTINQVFYDPGLNTGYFYIWRVPATASELLKFTWHRPIMDFTADTDNPDLPQEWIQCLYMNLAKCMLTEYPVVPVKAQQITAQADRLLDLLGGFDREAESICLQPDMG